MFFAQTKAPTTCQEILPKKTRAETAALPSSSYPKSPTEFNLNKYIDTQLLSN